MCCIKLMLKTGYWPNNNFDSNRFASNTNNFNNYPANSYPNYPNPYANNNNQQYGRTGSGILHFIVD